APAVALEQPVGKELVELGLLEGDVAVDPVLHALAQGADHGFGRLEVHVRHPERQDVGAVLLPLGAVAAPAVGEAIEVVGHGGSSYHARAGVIKGGYPWQCGSASSGRGPSAASSVACSPGPGTT